MSFLLDPDTCSAHLKRPAGLMHRFVQHRLSVSTIVLAEIYVWGYRRSNPRPVLDRIENDLLADVGVLDFDRDCAREFGRIRAALLLQGLQPARIDLMIAAVAIVHSLTLVTHNTSDYQNVPGLQLDDWLVP
jgi:tRNA(fMet)-specific endonuclease VapC